MHWVQGASDYVDLRLAADLPTLPRTSVLAALSAPAGAALARGEGFAGRISVVGGVCTWARWINLHGTHEGIDAGEMTWDSAGDLIETGVHGVYTELWQRVAPGPFRTRWFTCGARRMAVVWSDTTVAFGIGDPSAPRWREEHGLGALCSGVYGLGYWDGGRAVVSGATDPRFVGERLFTSADLEASAITVPFPSGGGVWEAQAWTAEDPDASGGDI